MNAISVEDRIFIDALILHGQIESVLDEQFTILLTILAGVNIMKNLG